MAAQRCFIHEVRIEGRGTGRARVTVSVGGSGRRGVGTVPLGVILGAVLLVPLGVALGVALGVIVGVPLGVFSAAAWRGKRRGV